MNMNIHEYKTSIWVALDRPFAEPNERWSESDGKYYIERLTTYEGDIIWFGCSVNWKKEKGSDKWKVLTTNHDAKPLEKYLPETVYGEDRYIFVECDTPIYEVIYQNNKQQIML